MTRTDPYYAGPTRQPTDPRERAATARFEEINRRAREAAMVVGTSPTDATSAALEFPRVAAGPGRGERPMVTTGLTRETPCPRCGGNRVAVEPFRGNVHKYEMRCVACGRHLQFVAAPLTPEQALEFVLPFGKHRDRTMCEVAGMPGGLSYLNWLAGQDRKRVNLAARIVSELSSRGGRSAADPRDKHVQEI